MRIGWIAAIIAIVSFGIALGQEVSDLTVATVSMEGDQLNGSITLKSYDGVTRSATGAGTWAVDAGMQVQVTGNWGGLKYSSSWVTALPDTTLHINALTGELSTESTPGTRRIEIVFELISVTGDTVDLGATALPNGRFFVRLYYPGNTYDAPHTWIMANGGTVKRSATWGGLTSNTITGPITKGTTYVVDALTGASHELNTPGATRCEFVFEPIFVTGETSDFTGAALPGVFSVGIPSHPKAHASPFTWRMANGGMISMGGSWGGLSLPSSRGHTIVKDTTYRHDALTQASSFESTPGVNRIEILFEPIFVTGATVDLDGSHLAGDFSVGVPSSPKAHDSPFTWRMANGGMISMGGRWGGLSLPNSRGHTIFKDTTYQYDALTGASSSELTSGTNRVELVFEVIWLTIATVDGAGNPVAGRVRFHTHPFYPTVTWHVAPLASRMAHGGLMEFFAEAFGIRSDTIRDRMYTGYTHILNGLTGEYWIEESTGVNRIEIAYSFNAPPTAAAGPDLTVEANTAGGAAVTLDGSGSTDDGEIAPLTFTWTWSSGSASGMTTDVFVPLGTTQVTLTVGDGEYTASDTSDITVQDTTPPEIACPGYLTLEAGTAGNGTAYADWLASVTASDICDTDVQVTNDAPNWIDLPIEGIDGAGTLVTWTAVDDSGNAATCSAVVRRLDTTPPEIAMEVTPSLIWPANHKLVCVQATVTAHDTVDPSPVIALVSITSNEPEDVHAGGDGSTELDIQDAAVGTCDFEFLLRAERQGASEGRIYTITYSATDACGNSQLATAEVIVPHEFTKQQP